MSVRFIYIFCLLNLLCKSQYLDPELNEKVRKIKHQDSIDKIRIKEQKEKSAKETYNYNRLKKINDSLKLVDEIKIKRKDSINYENELKRQAFIDRQEREYYLKIKIDNERIKAERKNDLRNDIITKYGNIKGELILNHKIEIGWNKQMCIDSWGNPKRIYTTTTAKIISEQWVYSLRKYLYFDNGILTAIQQ